MEHLPVILQIISVAFVVLGFFVAGFWRMWGLIKDVRSEAALRSEAAQALANVVVKELAAHKLHVAETYFPRANMREVMDPVMEAISGVRDQITGMSGRIDRLMERPAAPRARSG